VYCSNVVVDERVLDWSLLVLQGVEFLGVLEYKSNVVDVRKREDSKEAIVSALCPPVALMQELPKRPATGAPPAYRFGRFLVLNEP